MTPVLLDTGCIVALLDRSEHHHRQCVEVVGALQAPLFTCEAVIAESCHLLRNLQGAAAQVLENVKRGSFLLPYRLEENSARITELITRFSNIPMSLADACLVDMAGLHGTGRILTLDRDFEIYRWGRNRVFDPLLDIL